MIDKITPRWVLRVEEQLVSQANMAGFGQLFEKIGRAEEAGGKQAMIGFDFVGELLRGEATQEKILQMATGMSLTA